VKERVKEVIKREMSFKILREPLKDENNKDKLILKGRFKTNS